MNRHMKNKHGTSLFSFLQEGNGDEEEKEGFENMPVEEVRNI